MSVCLLAIVEDLGGLLRPGPEEEAAGCAKGQLGAANYKSVDTMEPEENLLDWINKSVKHEVLWPSRPRG